MRRTSTLLFATALVAGPVHHAPVHSVMLGRSVQGRPIVATRVGSPQSPVKVLVVGCIHGDECAGIAVARRLYKATPPPGVTLWIVPNLNPDGAAAGMRGNARGVDLNRNFPLGWRRGLAGAFDSGPRPLSEPESRIAARLIAGIRPTVTIWFHQHLNVVDLSGGDPAVERRFATAAHMRLRRLARKAGSVVGWENGLLLASTAFVVELPAGELGPIAVGRLARAVLAAAATPPSS